MVKYSVGKWRKEIDSTLDANPVIQELMMFVNTKGGSNLDLLSRCPSYLRNCKIIVLGV